MNEPFSKFADPDLSSVDRGHSTGPAAGGVVLPDPTPIFETARVLAELVAIRDRAK